MAHDELLRNSFFLTASMATMGVLGFAFWVLNSRLYSASQIGIATALISAASLTSYLGLVGVNTTFIRFLPASRQRDAEISSGLWIVLGAATLTATAFILMVPLIAPKLSSVRDSLAFEVGFVVLAAFAAVNVVTDSVFIAYRKSQFNLLIDGVIQGLAKLALAGLLLGLGAYGMFAASGLAATLAVAVSIVFMMRVVGYRPRLVVSLRFLSQAWAFSAANYAASLLYLCPTLAVPLVVLEFRGPSQAGYYYVAFQFAQLLNAAAYAVANTLLAEGSYESIDLAGLMRHSAKILIVVCVPSSAVVIVAGHWLLLAFGAAYSQQATTTLVVLAAAVPAVALNAWAATVLRITKQLHALIFVNALYAVAILGLAVLWAPRGLAWVAAAWLVGNLCAGFVAVIATAIRTRAMRPSARAPDQP